MRSLSHLFENNRAWSERIRRTDPDFFARLSQQQRPRYLWIGCADSRVPANEIVGLPPGELFVHNHQGTGSGLWLKAAYKAAAAKDHLQRASEKVPAEKAIAWLLR